MKSVLNIFSFVLAASLVGAPALAAKKYKRALVIAGGSITPAIGIGIMQALKEKGQAPDIVITTCGSSMSAAILNAYPNPKDALAYAKSPKFFNILSQLRINVPSAIPMAKTFDGLSKNPELVPPFFERPLMYFTNDLAGALPQENFPAAGSSGPRYIIQASKALFKPLDSGRLRGMAPLFQQVYFTDSETSAALAGFKSPVRQIFPTASVTEDIEIRSDVTTLQAMRGGISDPFLINPGEIGGEYYFTGAIDLFPMELAHELADEVISTYPVELYQGFQDLAVESAFGFKQTDRALHAIQDTQVKWIDMADIDDVNFEPKARFILIMNQVPKTLKDFGDGIQKQYDFGYSRAKEALKVQAHAKNVRTHLRKPINVKLHENFTCKNANVWKTSENGFCTKDTWTGCDRDRVQSCTPIR